MQISRISSLNGLNSNVVMGKSQPKAATENKQDIFEQYSAKKLPPNKAVQIGHRPGISLMNVLLLPFGFLGFSIKPTLKLVDIDRDNLTPKQQKLIRQGKMLDYVPRGYHIDEKNRIKKNK